MAGNNHFSAYIYKVQSFGSNTPTDLNNPNGVQNSFPSAGARFYPAPAGATSSSGATLNAIIELLPTGLQTGKMAYKFWTDSTVTTLAAAAT